MYRYKNLDKKFRKNVFRAGSLGLALLMASSGSLVPMTSFAGVEKVEEIESQIDYVTLKVAGKEVMVDYIDRKGASYLVALINSKNEEIKRAIEGKIVTVETEFLDIFKPKPDVEFEAREPGKLEFKGREYPITVQHYNGKQELSVNVDEELANDKVRYIEVNGDKVEIVKGKTIFPSKYVRLYNDYTIKEIKKSDKKELLELYTKAITDVKGTVKYMNASEEVKGNLDKLLSLISSSVIGNNLIIQSEVNEWTNKLREAVSALDGDGLEENIKKKLQELKSMIEEGLNLQKENKYLKLEESDRKTLLSLLERAVKLSKETEDVEEDDIEDILGPLKEIINSIKESLSKLEVDKKEEEVAPEGPRTEDKGSDKKEEEVAPEGPRTEDKGSDKKEEKVAPETPRTEDKGSDKKEEKVAPETPRTEDKGSDKKEEKVAPETPRMEDKGSDKKEEEVAPEGPRTEDKGSDKKEEKVAPETPRMEDKGKEFSKSNVSSKRSSSGSRIRFRSSINTKVNSGPGLKLRNHTPDYVTKTGDWKKTNDGAWTYSDNGERAKDKWVAIQDKKDNNKEYNWFRFDKDGKLVTGWYKDDDGNTYYMNKQSDDDALGAMRTGWTWIRDEKDGKLKAYYFNSNSDGTKGRMIFGTTVDGYTLNTNGEWVVDGVVQTK